MDLVPGVNGGWYDITLLQPSRGYALRVHRGQRRVPHRRGQYHQSRLYSGERKLLLSFELFLFHSDLDERVKRIIFFYEFSKNRKKTSFECVCVIWMTIK